MTKRFGWLVALLAIACLVALAADIDGKWTVTTQGRQGQQTQTLTLKADGEKLTGSIDNGRGGTDISEGMIHGNDVMFKVVREFNGNKFEQNYKGTLSGDDLNLTVENTGGGGGGGKGGGRGPQNLAFKRAK